MDDNHSDAVPENKVKASRRKILTSIVAGGIVGKAAVPDTWSKPVIDTIVLPSHGSTTGVSTDTSTTPPPVPADCSSSIAIAMVSTQNGALFVVGEADMPGACVVSTDSVSILCELISSGTVLGRERRSTANTDCADSTALTNGCMVSCSVSINAASHSVTTGDSITMRFSFGGMCVCSAVGTVS